MASLASVGAPGIGSQAPSQGLSETSSFKPGHRFDIMVFPYVRCKLAFEVIKNNLFSGMHKDDLDKYWCKWEVTSAVIDKVTTLHMTIPASATSFKFVVHTTHARNTSMCTSSFGSMAIEVLEDQSKRGKEVTHTNRITQHDYEKAKGHLPKDAAEQTITIGGSEKTENKTKT